MFHAQVEGKTFDVQAHEHGLSVDGKPMDWDLVALGNGQYHIRYRNQSYPAEIIKIDRETKSVELKVRGKKYTVKLRDNIDLLMEKMGMSAAGTGKVNAIKAPMPGLIIDLRIKAGDAVSAGDPLLILEAMKMENIIKSPGSATVKHVKIKKGDSVEKGQVLIEF